MRAMEKPPKVSVITPTYNRASFLPRVWESLRWQTESNFEWLVIDDGSTDDTAEVVKGFRDPRVRYIRLETNMGVNQARARGASEARAPYLVFLDSDDALYDHHTLAMMVEEIEKAPEGVGAVAFLSVDEKGRPKAFLDGDRKVLHYEDLVCERKARGEFISIERKSFVQAAPWSPYQGLENIHHWARAKQFSILFIRQPARVYYSDALNQLMSAAWGIRRARSMAEGTLRLIEEHQETWKRCCPHQYGRYLMYAGMYFALAGEHKRAIVYGWRALKHRAPLLKVGQLLIGCALPTSMLRFLFLMRAWMKKYIMKQL